MEDTAHCTSEAPGKGQAGVAALNYQDARWEQYFQDPSAILQFCTYCSLHDVC